jgi:hypothetical protein
MIYISALVKTDIIFQVSQGTIDLLNDNHIFIFHPLGKIETILDREKIEFLERICFLDNLFHESSMNPWER